MVYNHHIIKIKGHRHAPNKAWVLGSDRFKQQIQKQLERRVEPAARGGDRKSEQFKTHGAF